MNAVTYACCAPDNQRKEPMEGQLRECMEYCSRNGMTVIKENIADGPDGVILELMLEGMAEYDSAELSEKVIRGHTNDQAERSDLSSLGGPESPGCI